MQTLRSPEYQNRENCPDGGQWNVVLLTKMLGYLEKNDMVLLFNGQRKQRTKQSQCSSSSKTQGNGVITLLDYTSEGFNE